MINNITYAAIAILSFLVAHLWLKRTNIEIASKKTPSLFFKNISVIFFTIFTTVYASSIIIVENNDYIYQTNIFQTIIPLIVLGVLCIYSSLVLQIIACAIIAMCIPTQAVSNYAPITNFYLCKILIFAFLSVFSFTHSKQKRISGISFIETAALGATFFCLYFIEALPQIIAISGLAVAIVAYTIFGFTRIPCKIATTKTDNTFFGVFIAWFIMLGAPEYGLYSALIIFVMMFINIIFQALQKISNLSLKQNYDIYHLSITTGEIEEDDVYSFTKKSYIVMILIAISAITMPNPNSSFIIATAFGIWFLQKTYFLYQKKASWKNIYAEIKEDLKGKKNDTES